MNKKLTSIITAAIVAVSVSPQLAQIFTSPALAADYSAEIAVPSEAVVTVDGLETNLCAYNLYGSNYFMLRDVAVALSGTDKQFNVDWANNAVSLMSETAYESVGTEFSQNAYSSADALFSVPKVKLDGAEITLVGYNINGSNYFKIRDIARIFDFNIGYEYGHISIDTAKQYATEMPYESGSVIGMAHEANFALFINEMPIVSYYTAVDTAYHETQLERINENPRLNGVYVSARDLENYGFDVYLDGNGIWLTRNKDKKFGMLDGEIINSAPTGISEVYASDMKVYLDGVSTRNIKINGEPYISAAELLKYGEVSKRYGEEELYYKLLSIGINIDFMRKDLTEKFEAEPNGAETDLSDGNVVESELPGAYIPDTLIREYSGTSIKKTSMWKYEIIRHTLGSGISGISYIGGILNDRENGNGIQEEYSLPLSGNSMEARQVGSFSRGEFVDGKLVDGVYMMKSASTANYRNEGAMVNGYHRECNTGVGKEFRFRYRAVREGTIENGEYVGYYREYDEDGKLIFEGDYNDWVKQNG